MTDKEKIKAEIERLQKPTMDINHNFTSDYNQGLYDGLSQIELFIDSLPDVSETDFGKKKPPIREYVSPEDSTLGKLLKEMKDFSPQEDLGLSNEEYNNMVNELIFGEEKPVSKDLEEAAKQYADEHNILGGYRLKQFIAGAEWQKEQTIDKACEWLKSYRQDTYDGTGYIAGIVNDKTIEEFKKAMEE